MQDPPVWLLDVDGVINVTRPKWSQPPSQALVYADGLGYRMRWAPALIDRIRALHTTGRAEIRWCTTWCAYATQLEQLWRLPPLRRAFAEPVNGAAAALAKWCAARQVLDSGRRLVWTDDTETPPPGHPLHEEMTAEGRALLIRPRPRHGLQPEHLDQIEKFLDTE